MVYLVTGGHNRYGPMTYTEILVAGSETWSLVGNLPTKAISQLKGISFDNKIIMTGGVDHYSNGKDYLLSFDISSEEWNTIGNLPEVRYGHGIGLVPLEDIKDYCLP